MYAAHPARRALRAAALRVAVGACRTPGGRHANPAACNPAARVLIPCLSHVK
jgi:hypothetical protein